MIILGELSDFSDFERAKLISACKLVNQCLVDPVFLARLQGANFHNAGDSNAAVIAKLTANGTIMRLYCENMGWWANHVSHTIALEEPDGTVTFNRRYFDNQSIPSLANTLFHEYAHVCGYSHVSARDSTSVPYLAGNLLEAYAKSILNSPIS